MKITLELDVKEKCRNCKKPMVSNCVYINECWGAEQQILAQGAVVESPLYQVRGTCSKCRKEGGFSETCHSCDKPIREKDIAAIISAPYPDSEPEVYCKACYDKLSKEKLKELLKNDYTISYP